jgi:hypothetical protein
LGLVGSETVRVSLVHEHEEKNALRSLQSESGMTFVSKFLLSGIPNHVVTILYMGLALALGLGLGLGLGQSLGLGLRVWVRVRA